MLLMTEGRSYCWRAELESKMFPSVVLSAEADGSESHGRPRRIAAGEEVQQSGAEEGDHRAAGGRGTSTTLAFTARKKYSVI